MKRGTTPFRKDIRLPHSPFIFDEKEAKKIFNLLSYQILKRSI
jgi:hypothetical protein